eukprot:11210783-Karenia_brevis.AAC.1
MVSARWRSIGLSCMMGPQCSTIASRMDPGESATSSRKVRARARLSSLDQHTGQNVFSVQRDPQFGFSEKGLEPRSSKVSSPRGSA